MLKLKKGGLLERSKYGENKTYEVSEIAVRYLTEHIELDEDITMRDLFLIIEKNINIFELIFGNWIKEYTEEALYATVEPKETLSPNNKLEYVQLYWQLSIDDQNKYREKGEPKYEHKSLHIPSFPQFDGISVAVEDNEFYKKGDEIKWAMDFTPTQNYIDVPLKLNKKIIIYDENTNEQQVYYEDSSYTLYQVILGVIWEISFNGGPKDRDQKINEIGAICERIKNGTEELISMEDVFARIEDKLDLIDQENNDQEEL